MSNAVAVAEPTRQTKNIQAGSALSAFIPTNLEQAMALSRMIAESGMAPKSYETNSAKIFVGIMAGAEIGLTPFQALQSIAVIGNNPAVWGDGALALVQASNLLIDIEETDDGSKATCRLVRADRATPIVRTFSMDDAKKAGLSGKVGPWTNYPQRMRQMRARAWALRDGFADVLKGLRIAEEQQDMPVEREISAQSGTRLTTAMLETQAETVEGEVVDQSLADDQQFLRGEGPADEQMGEAHSENGTVATDDGPPLSEGEALKLIDRCIQAKILGDVINVEGDARKNADAFDDDQWARIQDAIAANRKRLMGPASGTTE